jgi:methionyl-tRNA formyltransferase
MKFVYFGSSRFSCKVLERIYQRKIIPSLIITQPEKPKGRGLKILPTQVSIFAQKSKIPFVAPPSLDISIEELLRKQNCDLFIVVDYGKILPQSFLSIPNVMPICLHPSFLPYYRGPAPINWAIINGEKETGVSIFKINKKIDAGEIILQKKVPIDYEDNIFSLTDKLIDEGSNLLIEAIEKIKNKRYTLTPQDESKASFAPKLTKKDGKINWQTDAEKIRNLIKGTLGWPSAYTYYNNKLLKILEADVVEIGIKEEPATVVKIDREGIYVATSNKDLKIKKVKPEGKKEMDAFSFVCGYRVKEKDRFF